MGVEAEEILAKVKQVKNVAVDGEIKQKAVRFMTHQEKEAKQADLEMVAGVLSPANSLPGHVLLTQDARKQLIGYQRFLKKDLAENCAPQKLPGDAKDALLKRREFLKDKIREGMPPHEIMRRNPPGAVSAHTKWMEATKSYQLEYKNVQRALEPDDSSEDLANIEMLRPSMAGPAGDASTFMADAQIAGFFSQSAKSKENYPEVFGHEYAENSPLAQAERRELEELRAEKTAREEAHKARQRQYGMSTRPQHLREKKFKQGNSPERLAEIAANKKVHSDKMKAWWAAKKAAAAMATEEQTEIVPKVDGVL